MVKEYEFGDKEEKVCDTVLAMKSVGDAAF